MKVKNLTKLIIRFLGGGKIDFPTSNLREVEIEPFDGEGGNEESGNNDELLLKSKQLIADYGSETFSGGAHKYVADDVELPDFYIYFDRDNKILYDCSIEMSYIDPQLIPVYLNSRNIGEDSIIVSSNNSYNSSNILSTPLNLFISTLPEGTVNKISFNVDDCIIYEGLI